MTITKDMKVAEIFERYPKTQVIFQKFGFGALLNPALRATFGRITSVETGCKFHGVGLESFLRALNDSLKKNTEQTTLEPVECGNIHDPKVQEILTMKTSQLVKTHPAVQGIFVKHFGEGCFSCPAFGMEDVAFACSMHNTDPLIFVQDCMAKIREEEHY